MEKACKYQIHNWLKSAITPNMVAATFTMKQRIGDQELDKMRASQNMRHFINQINQKVFGNSHKRFGKKLTIIPFLQNSAWDRLHYHAAIEIPNRIDFESFCDLIKITWRQTNFGRQEIDIQHLYSNGWIDYSLKHFNSAHTLDIENTHINC